jgi:RHS repeat-associated protein
MSGYGFTSAGTSYDDEDRLTGFARTSGTFTQSWNLTKVGDWTSVTTNGTAQNRTHGPTHELLTAGGQSLETDPKGNITLLPTVLSSSLTPQASRLIWDFDNKLRGADLGNNSSVDVNFQYDALGRRVARTGTGGSVVYVQHDQQTIADYPVSGVASTPTNRYVYASYIDEPVVRKAAGTGGTIHYYHRNQQYSITAMTTSTGTVAERYAYTAYGQPTILNASGSVLTSSAVGNRYTYTGREWDETLGLHHFRARWMSPLAGRFLGRDPIGFKDGASLYAVYFVQSDTDPSGLRKICCKFRLGWVISQYTVKELDCDSGKGAEQCCQDYAYTWHRQWAVDEATDQPCVRLPYVTQKCELLPVVTTTTITTTIQTCPKPLVSVHPGVIVSTVLVCANEAYIDDDPQVDLPPPLPKERRKRNDCKKASPWQLVQAGIVSEHKFKTEWGGVPNSRYDICACKDGSIMIADTKQCGTNGPKTMTDAVWK